MTNKQAYAGLLPCPFCGGEAKRFTIEEPGDNFGGDVICCQRCGASSHVEFGRKENLVSRWNTRPEAAEAISSLLKERDAARELLVIATKRQAADDLRIRELEGALREIAVMGTRGDDAEAIFAKIDAALNSDAPLSIGEGDRD